MIWGRYIQMGVKFTMAANHSKCSMDGVFTYI